MNGELPIIQKVYDLIRWYIPLVNKMPRDHKFGLGDRIAGALYTILDKLIEAMASTQHAPMQGRWEGIMGLAFGQQLRCWA